MSDGCLTRHLTKPVFCWVCGFYPTTSFANLMVRLHVAIADVAALPRLLGALKYARGEQKGAMGAEAKRLRRDGCKMGGRDGAVDGVADGAVGAACSRGWEGAVLTAA